MAKRDLTPFLVECIEGCWQAQKALLDDTCEEFRLLNAKVEAFQEVYAHLNDGDEYDGGSSEVLDEGPDIDSEEEEQKVPPEEDEEGDEESDEEESDDE
jgi:hypothetical protein